MREGLINSLSPAEVGGGGIQGKEGPGVDRGGWLSYIVMGEKENWVGTKLCLRRVQVVCGFGSWKERKFSPEAAGWFFFCART